MSLLDMCENVEDAMALYAEAIIGGTIAFAASKVGMEAGTMTLENAGLRRPFLKCDAFNRFCDCTTGPPDLATETKKCFMMAVAYPHRCNEENMEAGDPATDWVKNICESADRFRKEHTEQIRAVAYSLLQTGRLEAEEIAQMVQGAAL